MENKLFVGNLPWAATESDIRAHFSQAGEVVSVEVMMDKFTGRPRGFAFVTMGNAQQAQDAIAKTENIDFMGRPLKVNVARPREERPSFGGDRPRSGGFGGGDRPRSGGFGGAAALAAASVVTVPAPAASAVATVVAASAAATVAATNPFGL